MAQYGVMAEELRHQQEEEAWVPYDTFGARMALVRNHFKLSISEMAFKCGISKQDWNRWERGQHPRDERAVARKIVESTGCDYRWLREGGPMIIRCLSNTSPLLDLVALEAAELPYQLSLTEPVRALSVVSETF